jgi:hypothetical protein
MPALSGSSNQLRERSVRGAVPLAVSAGFFGEVEMEDSLNRARRTCRPANYSK